MDEFTITRSTQADCYVLRVSGDLDGDTAPWLERELDQLQTQLPVVIDLSAVQFLTSAGVVAVLSDRAFGRPTLVCPDDTAAAKILDIMGAQRLVPIYHDLSAALSARAA